MTEEISKMTKMFKDIKTFLETEKDINIEHYGKIYKKVNCHIVALQLTNKLGDKDKGYKWLKYANRYTNGYIDEMDCASELYEEVRIQERFKAFIDCFSQQIPEIHGGEIVMAGFPDWDFGDISNSIKSNRATSLCNAMFRVIDINEVKTIYRIKLSLVCIPSERMYKLYCSKIGDIYRIGGGTTSVPINAINDSKAIADLSINEGYYNLFLGGHFDKELTYEERFWDAFAEGKESNLVYNPQDYMNY